MPGRDELRALRQRAANVRHGEIIAAAEAHGWTYTATRGKGSHGTLSYERRKMIVKDRRKS